MGRKSKLSDAQWADVGRRLIEGESARALGREFEVSEASIREHFAKEGKKPTVQKVAKMIVETDAALKSLPESAQVSAQNLARRLQNISLSIASAAEQAAMTSHRLSALANSEVAKIDDATPLASMDSLKGVAVLTRMANDSAHIPLNLLSANKEMVRRLAEEEEQDDLPMTPERQQDGVRRMAFLLHKAATNTEPAHG